MTKDDVAAIVLSRLLGDHLDHDRIAHLPLDKRIDALCVLAVYASDRLVHAVNVRRDNNRGFTEALLRDWFAE